MTDRTALLIIDIQNDYFDGGANPLVGSLAASENAGRLLECFRRQSLPVIHIQHLSSRPGATFFIPETTGAMIHENVAPIANEKVVIKHYPNSFRETELLPHLQAAGITKLVICGMMTQMCIDATTRAAKDHGFDCIVIGDACASKDLDILGDHVTAAQVQTAFLAALSYFYATVQTTTSYLAAADGIDN